MLPMLMWLVVPKLPLHMCCMPVVYIVEIQCISQFFEQLHDGNYRQHSFIISLSIAGQDDPAHPSYVYMHLFPLA